MGDYIGLGTLFDTEEKVALKLGFSEPLMFVVLPSEVAIPENSILYPQPKWSSLRPVLDFQLLFQLPAKDLAKPKAIATFIQSETGGGVYSVCIRIRSVCIHM